jgi:hypothetical protein
MGTVGVSVLQKPHEEQGILAQLPFQLYLLAGLFIPLELAPLHKEFLRRVPARHFHEI